MAGSVVGALLAFAPAHAYTAEIPSWANCQAEAVADLGVLEHSLTPAGEAPFEAGSPVTFSGNAPAQLSIAIASSLEALATPDVDSGAAAAGALVQASPQFYAYSFTSTKATAVPRTVYWQASFSDATLPRCTGLTPTVYRTEPRALGVLAVPTPVVQSPEGLSPSAHAPVPLRIRILAVKSLRDTHPGISFRVECTGACSGRAEYRVLLARDRRRLNMRSLALAPTPVSIAGVGGSVEIASRFRGAALRRVKRMLRSGDQISVQIELALVSAAGEPVGRRASAHLRR